MFLFKDPLRMTPEFCQQIDGRLRAVIRELAAFCDKKYDKHVVITCLNRTPEENKAAGGSEYSAHLYGRAVDIRVKEPVTGRWHFTPEQQQEIKEWLEKMWGLTFLFVKTDIHGTAPHIHININYGARNTWA